jgi:8-oxo-dGTP pyrophosphatase MutT (NUDIX family)
MNPEIQIYDSKPNDFSPKIEVAATYVNANGKLLLLQIGSHKSEGGTWTVPAGKIELGEEPVQGAKRELFEETGIQLASEKDLRSLGTLYIRKPNFDYVYHLFGIDLGSIPSVRLSLEHRSYQWVSRNEAEKMPLMHGATQALEAYYRNSLTPSRTGVSVNVYLVLRKKDEILLLLRKNTGYCDGQYSLVAGHVEDGESATAAMAREAYEEAGIHIVPSSLKAVHAMHRVTTRFNIDLFFECDEWQGSPTNREPDKCATLEYFPLQQLPPNTIDYINEALKAISNRSFYSEHGWKQ